jgi:hypothetical protein
VIVSGGANSGWGVAYEQIDSAADTTREVIVNFLGPVGLTSDATGFEGQLAAAPLDAFAFDIKHVLDFLLTAPQGGFQAGGQGRARTNGRVR